MIKNKQNISVDSSKFGDPLIGNGKKMPLTPNGLRHGRFGKTALDFRQFNWPAHWTVLSVADHAEYDNNGNPTDSTHTRFMLMNGNVAKALKATGTSLDDSGIQPTTVNLPNGKTIDKNQFSVGDSVKLIRPVVFPQGTSMGNSWIYTGVQIIAQSVKKEG